MGWIADELATARQRPDGHRNAERKPPGTHAGGAPRTLSAQGTDVRRALR